MEFNRLMAYEVDIGFSFTQPNQHIGNILIALSHIKLSK